MSEESTPIKRKSDNWVDALAAVALVGLFITAMVYWISSQS